MGKLLIFSFDLYFCWKRTNYIQADHYKMSGDEKCCEEKDGTGEERSQVLAISERVSRRLPETATYQHVSPGGKCPK